ncbi:hypothetical protein HK097_007231 [Rhizophlyctis rosea]|uniref:Uncharacterized protein n=1 Tax=Rhizophlyctis rosea TaxID=64517 RepID=A0AAD5X1R9_9FUNG|nr:hypothetical protein HK097_007231 [Rhizophlyctis rosea]
MEGAEVSTEAVSVPSPSTPIEDTRPVPSVKPSPLLKASVRAIAREPPSVPTIAKPQLAQQITVASPVRTREELKRGNGKLSKLGRLAKEDAGLHDSFVIVQNRDGASVAASIQQSNPEPSGCFDFDAHQELQDQQMEETEELFSRFPEDVRNSLIEKQNLDWTHLYKPERTTIPTIMVRPCSTRTRLTTTKSSRTPPILRLPPELLRIIALLTTPTAAKNLRCSAKPFLTLITLENLIFLFANHLWRRFNKTCLNHICRTPLPRIRTPPSFEEPPKPKNPHNGFHNARACIFTTLIRGLIKCGAKCPARNSAVLATALDTNNQKVVTMLLDIGARGNFNVDPLLRTCQTDPYEILQPLLARKGFFLHFKSATLVKAALKGWHRTVRALDAKGAPDHGGHHLAIWIAAVRDNNHASIDYFTANRPQCRSSYTLLKKAIELTSVYAVKKCLEIPDNNSRKHGGTLQKLIKDCGNDEIREMVIKKYSFD